MIGRFLCWLWRALIWRHHPVSRVWAYRDSRCVWHKIVSLYRPAEFWSDGVQGPFRSEIDCEEFCDHANAPLANKVRLYRPIEELPDA